MDATDAVGSPTMPQPMRAAGGAAQLRQRSADSKDRRGPEGQGAAWAIAEEVLAISASVSGRRPWASCSHLIVGAAAGAAYGQTFYITPKGGLHDALSAGVPAPY